MVNFYFIRNNLDGQIPYSFEELVVIGENKTFDLSFLGITMQTVTVTFQNGEIDLNLVNHPAHIIIPLICTIFMSMLIIFVGKIVKRMTSKYEL